MLICDDEPMARPAGRVATDQETATLFTYVYNDPVNRIDPSGQQTLAEGMFGVTPAGAAALAAQAQADGPKLRWSTTDLRRLRVHEIHYGIKLDLKEAAGFTRPVSEGGWLGSWAAAEDVDFEGENFKLIWVFGGNDPRTDRPTVVVGAVVPAPAGAGSDRAAAQEWFDHRNEELKSAAFSTLKEVAIMAAPELWALRAARNVRSVARAVEAERAAVAAERAAVSTEETAARARLFAKKTETGSNQLPAGTGWTDKFGNVEYSTLGSADDVALARFHESVHSLLSPKLLLLREFRANIVEAGYQRSSFLKYLEEALAETYAQLRVRGFKGLPTGIKFPVKEGYVTVRAVVTEGAIGTVVVGGITYGVYYLANK